METNIPSTHLSPRKTVEQHLMCTERYMQQPATVILEAILPEIVMKCIYNADFPVEEEKELIKEGGAI